MLEKEKNYEKYGGFRRDFTWLIEHLLPFSDRIKGCEMIFPDTLFIKEGKPAFLAKMDGDFCLQLVKNKTKLNLDRLSDWHKEQKKEVNGVFTQKYGFKVNMTTDKMPQF